jgi:hypothetical protein
LRDWLLATLWRLLLRLVPVGDRARLWERPRQLRTRSAQRAAGWAAEWDMDALALDLDAMALDVQLTLRLPGTTRIRADRAGPLLRHSIVRLNQTTSHALQFQGGGFFSFMVDDQQTMMEVYASNVRLSTTRTGMLEVLPLHPLVE